MPNTTAVYRFDAVDYLVQDIVLREAAWQEYFHAADVTPLTVVYEDYVSAPEATVRTILAYLGVAALGGWTLPTLQEQPLADARSERWTQQYRSDKQANWGKKSWE